MLLKLVLKLNEGSSHTKFATTVLKVGQDSYRVEVCDRIGIIDPKVIEPPKGYLWNVAEFSESLEGRESETILRVAMVSHFG